MQKRPVTQDTKVTVSRETRANILAYLDRIHPESISAEKLQQYLQINATDLNNTIEKMCIDGELIVENDGQMRVSEHLVGQFQSKDRPVKNFPKKIKLVGQEPAEWKKVALFVLGFFCVLGLVFLAYSVPDATAILVYSSGILFIGIVIIIAFMVPNPTHFQYVVFRTVLSIFTGAVASLLPGVIGLSGIRYIDASGALAVFVVVYLWDPAKFAVSGK